MLSLRKIRVVIMSVDAVVRPGLNVIRIRFHCCMNMMKCVGQCMKGAAQELVA